MTIVQALFGILVFCGIAWGIGRLTESGRAVSWKLVGVGLLLQIVLAVILLQVPIIQQGLLYLNNLVKALDDATGAGTSFVFGYVGGNSFTPFETTNPPAGFILAFRALPLVMVIGALTSLLFYWKILPLIVRGLAFALEKTLSIGGAVGLSAAANIFVGMVEAPLFIKPYMQKLSRSELFMVMATGMATIAGTMMVLYAFVLQGVLGDAALGHLLVASILSAPAAIVMAHLMVPPEANETPTSGELIAPHPAENSMDAVTQGGLDGLKLWLNIIAMLIVLIALVALVNTFFAWIHGFVSDNPNPQWLQTILGVIMMPLSWLMGIPYAEAFKAGELMGIKTITNEFIAYSDLVAHVTLPAGLEEGADLPAGYVALSDKTQLILSYALCGFANLGSLGIMIGGLGGMAPERRGEIAALGFHSIVAGTLATMITGTVAGIVYSLF